MSLLGVGGVRVQGVRQLACVKRSQQRAVRGGRDGYGTAVARNSHGSV